MKPFPSIHRFRLRVCLLATGYSLLATLAPAATPLTDVKLSGANNQVVSGSTFTFKAGSALTVEEGVTVTGISGGGGGEGSVTSVGLGAPASLFTVTGSPVTSTGTLTLALAAQQANRVFAGPTSGASATPTFRALVAADVSFAAPVFNVVTGYGAKLDGTTDDAGAIQNAINAAAASKGIVYIPAGTAKLGSAITPAAGVRLVGAGRSATILKAASAGQTLLNVTANDVTVESLQLDGAYTSGGVAGSAIVAIAGADRTTLRDVSLVNANSSCVYISGGADDTAITDCRLSNFFTGVASLTAGSPAVAPQRIRIDGCSFTAGWGGNVGGAGAVKIQTDAAETAWSRGHRIINNVIDTPGQMGIELWHLIADTIVSDNTIRNGTWGISLNYTHNTTVTGNSVALMTYMGIEVTDGCREITVTGNAVDGWQADGVTRGTDYGIVCTGTSVIVARANLVGNVVRGCDPWAIILQNTEDATVRANMASDSGQLISVKNSDRIDVTGNMLAGPCDRHMWLETTDQNSSGLRIQGNTFTGAATAVNIFFADYGGGTHTWGALSIVDNDLSAATNASGTILDEVGAADMPSRTYRDNYYITGAGKAVIPDNTVLTDYADNAAALAGGLVAGQLYRTGDAVKIVH